MKTEVVICGVPFGRDNELEILKRLKEDGVTSIQIYMHWHKFETEQRGKFDFSFYDRQVNLIKEAGLKFVPFFLMGPRYAAPKWWLESEKHRGLTCLEHGKECPVESIWNEDFRIEIDRVLKAFAEHYLPMDVLESIQPGICGDYGEAIMPVHGNWAGAYHTHRGMWCAGEDAVQDFKRAMVKKYKSVNELNKAWRSHYADFEELRPFMSHKAPSRTAWFDLVEWYRGVMNDYVDFWMKTTRKYFPDTPIYMCTGGLEAAQDASLFSEQAKICAKYNGGIRLTNEWNDFFENFFATAYTHSACEQYGAYFGLEPVGPLTKHGIGSRIFSSSVFGNRQIFFYYGNISRDGNIDNELESIFKKYISLVKEYKAEKKTAVFWPGYIGIEDGGVPKRIEKASKFLRRITDYSFANENMINDGFLEKVKLLIIPCEIFTSREVAEKICKWVENGGILFSAGRIFDLELEPIDEIDKLIGLTPESDFCEGRTEYEIRKDIPFKNFEKRGCYLSEFGYTRIAEDANVLAEVKGRKCDMGYEMYTETVYNAFYRKAGKGITITYFGPDSDEETFCSILEDVALEYGEDLRTKAGEVVRGKIRGELYALYPQGDIKKVD